MDREKLQRQEIPSDDEDTPQKVKVEEPQKGEVKERILQPFKVPDMPPELKKDVSKLTDEQLVRKQQILHLQKLDLLRKLNLLKRQRLMLDLNIVQEDLEDLREELVELDGSEKKYIQEPDIDLLTNMYDDFFKFTVKEDEESKIKTPLNNLTLLYNKKLYHTVLIFGDTHTASDEMFEELCKYYRRMCKETGKGSIDFIFDRRDYPLEKVEIVDECSIVTSTDTFIYRAYKQSNYYREKMSECRNIRFHYTDLKPVQFGVNFNDQILRKIREEYIKPENFSYGFKEISAIMKGFMLAQLNREINEFEKTDLFIAKKVDEYYLRFFSDVKDQYKTKETAEKNMLLMIAKTLNVYFDIVMKSGLQDFLFGDAIVEDNINEYTKYRRDYIRTVIFDDMAKFRYYYNYFFSPMNDILGESGREYMLKMDNFLKFSYKFIQRGFDWYALSKSLKEYCTTVCIFTKDVDAKTLARMYVETGHDVISTNLEEMEISTGLGAAIREVGLGEVPRLNEGDKELISKGVFPSVNMIEFVKGI